MKPRLGPAYRLSHELVAQHCASVMLLDPSAIGKYYQLHRTRPGADHNVPFFGGALAQSARTSAPILETGTKEKQVSPLLQIEIRDVLEQRAGYQDECGGWSDGHDAIGERFLEAFETSDVLAIFDSPGGAAAGCEQNVNRVVEAKRQSGRYVTGYIDELCASGALWWAMCVCDEIWGPPAMKVGSIGAYAPRASFAKALAIEGIDFKYDSWPGAGKVAFAPELPFSEIADRRGRRDIEAVGKRFAQAIVRSDLGQRLGLRYDAVIALDSDTLPGEYAVAAKLVNGIASRQDVEMMAWEKATRSGENT